MKIKKIVKTVDNNVAAKTAKDDVAFVTTKATSAKFVRKAIQVYGSYVIGDRAVGDARDGQKPVQLRILFAMHELGATSDKAHRKSAKITGDTTGNYHPHGDCLAGDTLLYSLDGSFYALEDLVSEGTRSLDVLAFDAQKGSYVPAVAHSFRVGQQAAKTYLLTLSDGSKIEATGNHPFHVPERGWVKTSDLTVGTNLSGGTLRDDDRPFFTPVGQKGEALQHLVGWADSEPDAEDDVIHHKNESTRDNRPENLEWLSRADHARVHRDNAEEGLAKGRAAMFTEGTALREAIRAKNSALMSAYNADLPLLKALKILRMIRDDGKDLSIKRYNRYRSRVYNGTRLATLESKGYSFADLVNKMDTHRVDTSSSVGKTEGLAPVRSRASSVGDTSRAIESNMRSEGARVIALAAQKFGRITKKTYNKARHLLIDEYGLGQGNVYGRSWPKARTLLKRYGTFERVLKRGGVAGALFVSAIDVLRHRQTKPMYDFTVGNYENAVIATTDPTKRHVTLVVAHNSAVYDTMCNMVHAANPLIDPHGNFGKRVGTIEEDPAAASRYTEARLTKLGEAMLEDLADVDYGKNYSGDRDEPLFLPARVPLILANGSEGIAVGMSAKIPPHNLGELIDASIAAVKNPDISTKGLMKFIHGPDQGYGVLTSPAEDVLSLYKTGKGSLTYRCRYELGESKGGDKTLIVTSPAPSWNPNKFKTSMASLAEEKLIVDVRDESKDDLRIIVSYKDVRILRERVLPALNTTESYQFYTVKRGGDGVLSSETLVLESLRTMVLGFVGFRRTMETRRTKRLLSVAKANLKRQRALLIGTLNVKTVAKVVDRKSNKTLDDMKTDLCKTLNPSIKDPKYKLDPESAGFILETAIWKLGRLNVPELKKKIATFVAEVKALLHDLKHIDKVIIRRLEEMRKFATARRTQLRTAATEVAGGASSGYVVARNNGQILKTGNAVPVDAKRSTFDHVVKVKDRALAITGKGVVRSFHLAYTSEEKFSGGIVGLAKDSDKLIAVVDESGRGVCIDPEVKKDEISPIKNQKGKVVGTGVGKGESLLAVCKSGTCFVVPVDDLKVTRPNVLAYQLAGANEKVLRLLRVPANAVIVHGRNPVKPSKGTFEANPDDALFVVAAKNYAVIDKEKTIADQTTVLAALKSGKCKHTVPA